MGVRAILATPVRALQRMTGAVADALDLPAPRPGARRPSAPSPGERSDSDRLMRQLYHRGAPQRAAAAARLGELGVAEATELLVVAAGDRKRLVRRAALGALLQLAPQSFVDAALALAERLPRDELFADLDLALQAGIPGADGAPRNHGTGAEYHGPR